MVSIGSNLNRIELNCCGESISTVIEMVGEVLNIRNNVCPLLNGVHCDCGTVLCAGDRLEFICLTGIKGAIETQLIHGDCRDKLPMLAEESVDLAVIDSPYFLDKLDGGWDPDEVSSGKNQGVVTGLPAGMKFDREQGMKLYEWFKPICEELQRVLKPGAFLFSFSAPRLYHRMACAIEDADFELRDQFHWVYTQSQPKAMGMDRQIEKRQELNPSWKERLDGWKTPQVKSCYEPIAVAQKPRMGTFLDNMTEYGTGLINTNLRVGDNRFPANILAEYGIHAITDQHFVVPKPTREEKGETSHKTVKPLSLCEFLIRLTTLNEDAVVLDCFAGSGTTLVAAQNVGRKFIGIEKNAEYVADCRRRLEFAKRNDCKPRKLQAAKLHRHGNDSV